MALPPMRLRRIAIFTLGFLAALLLGWISVPATILPPEHVDHPVTIYVADYGLHSRLVLPDIGRQWIQYAYGDWNYYALNRQGLTDGIAALLLPTPGTLGRRSFATLDEMRVASQQDNATLIHLAVSSERVAQLLISLNHRFEGQIAVRTQNPRTGLTLVQDAQKYTVMHNSNHELVQWLKELDCQVTGFVLWSNFRVDRRSA
ncbi:MAG: hypothetical protein VKJ46_06520 [Leptolyngbyaceae bacterium]|nr:hypothetical protein [Leptolyngbyaceae bacterium]